MARSARAVALGAVLLAAACTPSATPPPASPSGSAVAGSASASASAPVSVEPSSLAPTERPSPSLGACGGATAAELPWWNDRVFYEVFVRSFKDSDGDGIGDLKGLISKLDYLNDGDPSTTDDLGVTGLWLMPVTESPSYHGYDVSDYEAIEKDYGSVADFKQLMTEAHKRGIAVIVDMVFNHTSRDHPWFQDAMIPGSAHDAWYEWSDAQPPYTKPGGGQVWWRAGSRFYYGYFDYAMPDLNFRNPEVTTAIDDISKFWIEDMGVDGFRMDAIKHFFEQDAAMEELPETHAWLAAYQTRLKALKPDMLTVGEVYSATNLSAAYVPDDVSLTFDFGFAENVVGGLYAGGAGQAVDALKTSLADYPPGQRAVFLTNHDQTRTMTKLGGDINGARAAGAVLLTSSGVPFIYYGEELGMTGDKPDERIRTPMPWTDKLPTVGFTSGTPWEPVGDGAETANVAAETGDPSSVLAAYRDLIALRSLYPSLGGAEMTIVPSSEAGVYAVLRHLGDETTLVLVNFGLKVESPSFDLSVAPCVTSGMGAEAIYGQEHVAAVTDPAAYVPLKTLAPYEVSIIKLGG